MAVVRHFRSRSALRIAVLAVAAPILLTTPFAARQAHATPVTSHGNIPFSGISPGGVDMATGELILVMRPDLFMDGPFPVEFGRYYASMLAREGLASGHLGPNWLGTYDWTLSIAGSNATLVTNRGEAIRFIQGVGGAWNLVSPVYAKFKLDLVGGAWRVTNPLDRRIYFFDGTTWLLTQILDEHGNALNLTYTGTLLTQVSDGLGRTLQFQYDASNHLIQVSDGPQMVHYSYTGSVLTSFVDGNSNIWGYAVQPGPILGLLTGILEPLGNTPITNAYDASGRVSSQTDALTHTATYGYDLPSGNTFTDPMSNTWTYLHDSQNRLTTLMDPMGGPTSYGYDPLGRIQMVSRPMGDPTNFGYDAASGYPNMVTLADGPMFSWGYGSHLVGGATLFDVTTASYPDGTNKSFGRDGAGNVTDYRDQAGQHWLGTYNARGQLLTWTNPASGVTTFTYDPLGRPATGKDNANNVTHYSFDGLSRLMRAQWPDGTSRSYAYDNLNALTGLTDERGKVWGRSYDQDERLGTETDPLLEATSYGYDGADRLTSITDPLGLAVQYSYDATGRLQSMTDRSSRTTTYQYDTLDRLTGIMDPAGGTDGFGYDADSRIISRQDPLGHTMTFDHNFRDLVTHITDQVGSGFDYGYDSMGRLHTATGPLGLSLTYGYDGRGFLTSFADGTSETDFPRTTLGEIDHVRDPNGNNWGRTYDPQGRLTSASDPLTRTTTYEYDPLSRPIHVGRPDGTLQQIDYDAAGRIMAMTFGATGPSFSYSYDDANRLVSGNGASFSYDAAGRMTHSNGFTMAYDPEGRPLSETLAPGKTVSYSYESRGLLSQVQDWTGGTTSFSYDTARRLTGITRPNGTSGTYDYDAANRLINKVEKQPGPNGAPIASIAITRDVLGQPTSITRRQPLMPGQTMSSSSSFTYDAASQQNGAGHDPLGRTTSQGSRAFQWDGASRLTHFVAGADSPSYAYDAFGQQTRGTQGGQVVQQAWNYGWQHPDMDDTQVNLPSNRTRYFVRAPSGLLLYSVDGGTGGRSFYHYDEAGNTAFLTSDGASVTAEYAYTPFGGVSAVGATSDNPFTFGGAGGALQLGGSGAFQIGGGIYDAVTMRTISGNTTASGPGGKDPGPPGSPGSWVELNPQPFPPGASVALNPQPFPPGPGSFVELNPQPLPPGASVALNPQPFPPSPASGIGGISGNLMELSGIYYYFRHDDLGHTLRLDRGGRDPGPSGLAEVCGNDVLVTLGPEVIVDFLEGDPDAPIVTGGVYNRESAGTLMHELGHTFGLDHGGKNPGPNGSPGAAVGIVPPWPWSWRNPGPNGSPGAAVEIVPPWPWSWRNPGPPGSPGAAVEIVPPWPWSWKNPGPTG